MTWAQTKLSKNVVSNGGIKTESTSHGCVLTIGQSLTGKIKSNNNETYVGFWFAMKELNTSISTIEFTTPKLKILDLNIFPNPFYSIATIEFEISVQGRYILILSDINGRTISKLMDDYMAPGKYQIPINAEHLIPSVYNLSLVSKLGEMHQKFIVVD